MAGKSKYPEQFRRDAVGLVRSGRAVREVARELGIHYATLHSWVVKDRERQRPGGLSPTPDDRDMELVDLRKRVAELELEKEILRKAAAYFAKEMGR
ncbi:transposase [Allorhizocola rhizosphaerae]|uniref:transposase n=1 Tax=Allorhizocola rhizosphaerae TaxID=1872709 RepID=UPI0013C34F6D|nr:transposase [Allorhizocola rhizosphaerae]